MSHFSQDKKNKALFDHIIATFGNGNQIVKASEEYAEVSAAIARAFNDDREAAMKDMAAEMADAEIMRQQLCLIFPNLPGYLEVAYRMKMQSIAKRTEFSGQLEL